MMKDSDSHYAPTKSGPIAMAEMARSRRSRFFGDFASVRKVLRGASVSQGGSGIQTLKDADPEDVTLFFVDGEVHRRRRASIAPYFSLKAIEERYEPVMRRWADVLVERLERSGGGRLEDATFRYAVAVAAEALGMDYADLDEMTERFGAILDEGDGKRTTKELDDPAVRAFYETDVQPAIDRRRREPREDVISAMIAQGHSDRFIRTELRAYAVGGMVTTREFISMVAWYLLEDPALLDRFRSGSATDQFAILDEIIRLEPVVAVVKREVTEPFEVAELGECRVGDILAIDIRKTNVDEGAAGACPHAFDPDRENRMPPKSGYMSFGAGPHRCPGALLALHESRIFLDRLVRMPDITLVSEPRVTWYRPIASYEIKDVIIACEKPDQGTAIA